MSYHRGRTTGTVTRRAVGITTVMYQPGAGGSGIVAATPPASTPIAYRIPSSALLAPAISSQTPVFAPGPTYIPATSSSNNANAPPQAVATTPGSVAALQNFLATQQQSSAVSPAAEATTGPPAPELASDGTPATPSGISPVVLGIAAVVALLIFSGRR